MMWPLRKAENSGPPLALPSKLWHLAAPAGQREKKPSRTMESLKFVESRVFNKPFVLTLDIKAGGDTCSWSCLGLMALWVSGLGTWTGVGSWFPQAANSQ